MTNDLNTLREALEHAETLMRRPVVSAGEVNLHATEIVNRLRAALSRLEAAAAAEYERGRQDGMKQEHAMWKLSRLGQEIEAAAVPELSREDVGRLTREAGGEYRGQWDLHQFTSAELQRFASLVRSVPVKGNQL